MDAQTCLKKLQYVGVLAFSTVDSDGNPQVRNISAIHYEPDAMYFFYSEEKEFLPGAVIRRARTGAGLHPLQLQNKASRPIFRGGMLVFERLYKYRLTKIVSFKMEEDSQLAVMKEASRDRT